MTRTRCFAFVLLLAIGVSPIPLFAQGGPLRIQTNELPSSPVGVPYSFTLIGAGGVRPYTWTATGLPAGLSISLLTGVISGTPSASGSFNVTVTLRDVILSRAEETFTLVIDSFSISTPSLPNGSVGVPYQQTLTATGGIAPITWSIQSGSLPPGLSLSQSGTISGTPTTVGTSNVTIRARDGASRSADKAFSITITPPISISTTSLPNGVVGAQYNTTLAASGGSEPYEWSVISGTLPAGLSLSSGGTLSGSPTSAVSSDVTIRVRDSSTTPQTASRTFTVRIDTALSMVSGPTLPGGVIGQAYNFQLQASGGRQPYNWSLNGGVLPNGLTLNSAGVVSGTPLANGNFNFTVTVADAASPAQSVTRTLSIMIGNPLSIVTQSPLASGAVGAPYTTTLSASGGAAPLSWSVTNGQLPPGLTLASGGTISGTPVAPGSFTFTARVSDAANQTASRTFNIDIQTSLTIITSSPLPNGTMGVAYSFQLQASLSGPLVWAVVSGTLPPGITLSPGGVLSGTPTGTGAFTFTVEVQGGLPPQTSRQTFRLDVAPGVSVTTSSLASGTVGTGYAVALAASGGTAPYTWTIASGSLPPGLSLSSAGVMSGTPTQAGTFNFTVRVQDNGGGNATRPLSVAISAVNSDALVLSGVPSIMNPTQQVPVGLSLRSASSTPLAGTLTITFTPNAIVGTDDAVVRFSNGSRSVRFSIAANSTNAAFPSQVVLLTGTVAGTITFNASIDGSSGATEVGSVLIQPLTPQFSDVSASRSPGNLRVQITGYSPERRVSSVEFTFDIRVGGGIERVTLTRNVESEFDIWYRNPASETFGSAFLFAQTFAVDGDVNAIEAVTVRLANGQGIGVSPSAPVGN